MKRVFCFHDGFDYLLTFVFRNHVCLQREDWDKAFRRGLRCFVFLELFFEGKIADSGFWNLFFGSGKIAVGDKLIAVDGWPCYGQPSQDVTAKITGWG